MEPWVAALLAALLACLGAQRLWSRRHRGRPPCIGGWLPWVGAALRLGKAPLEFIEQARRQYGPVFTLYMLGKRYTFITEEEGYQVFYTSKDADFEQAVQQSIEHAVSVPKEIFYQNRLNFYMMMKGRLSPLNLPLLIGSICAELQEHMQDLGAEGTKSLHDLVRHIMFPATVNILFGKDVFLKTENNIKELQEHFQNYDDDFEYATLLPEYLMKKWSKSKKWLLEVFEKVVLHAKRVNPPDGDSKTLLHHILDTLTVKCFGPNYGLLLLWAAQANAVPNFVIPAGDMLMLSPYWSHRNPKYFPEPDIFKPDRWKAANLEKNAFLEGFMAFGGGSHQCPGRWFAIAEIQVLVVLFLYKYECSLMDPVPKESPLHLVGTQQPEGPCRIRYKRRT